MRTWIVVALTAFIGIGIGWLMHDSSSENARFAQLSPQPKRVQIPIDSGPTFPELPKPPLETPIPITDEVVGQPAPLMGNISSLPSPAGGPIGPYAPNVPDQLPTADLNADEALARRIILENGGDVVASSDAKDSSGKIGKSLVAEVKGLGVDGLRAALRKTLGDRAVLSDGGTVPGTVPTAAEDALAVAKRKRDQARIDFLPEAPALRQIEEDYLAQERAVAQIRKASGRARLNVLIRPVL
jgi:hypothetical protein